MRSEALILIAFCGGLAACAEKLLPESENINVLQDTSLARHCAHLGNTFIQSKNPAMNNERQSETLLIKAKNLAYELGADTIVPMPTTFKDRQPFRFYICARNDNNGGDGN